MIQQSIALMRRIEYETCRCAGSLARLLYYAGTMPIGCELRAESERVQSIDAPEPLVRDLAKGKEPHCPEGITYWRLLDNNGNCVMQGDWQ